MYQKVHYFRWSNFIHLSIDLSFFPSAQFTFSWLFVPTPLEFAFLRKEMIASASEINFLHVREFILFME